MNNRDFKISLTKALLARPVYTTQPSKIEIRTRCPFCGDSQKSINSGHLYIRINPDDNFPIVYNCFKCPAQGILKPDDLEFLGIYDSSLMDRFGEISKTFDKVTSQNNIQVEEKYFDYKLNIIRNAKTRYIEDRLQLSLSDSDLYDLKVIPSFKDFLYINNINSITCKSSIAQMLEENYVGFLSSNGGYILFRDITNKSNIRWYKYAITNESRGQKQFYSIKSDVDLYSKDTITINLAEGVFDTLSIYCNYFYKKDNTLNISICGKYYLNTVKHIIGMGFIGDNIRINIFADRDYTKDTSIDYLQDVLGDYKYLVGSIYVYYNIKAKDCGVSKDQISLQEYKI